MNQEIIFKAFSFYEFLRSVVIRLFAIIIGIYSFAHYDENPIVISIVMSISLLVIILIGSPEIILYSDRIVKRNDSFVSLIKPGTIYLLTDIEEASFVTPSEKLPTIPEIGLIAIIALIIPKRGSGSSRTKPPVLLKMTDGSTKWLVSDLEYNLKDRLTIEINNAKKAAANMGFAKVRR